jgi:hypothetical protein
MPSGLPSRFRCDEDLAMIGYDGRDAEKDLARWRNRGPRPETQELIDAIQAKRWRQYRYRLGRWLSLRR